MSYNEGVIYLYQGVIFHQLLKYEPEQPVGEERGVLGCKRRFQLNNNGNAMHLCGEE